MINVDMIPKLEEKKRNVNEIQINKNNEYRIWQWNWIYSSVKHDGVGQCPTETPEIETNDLLILPID